MCHACAPPGGWSRRAFLATVGASGAGLLLPGRAASAGQSVDVLPRSAWAGEIPPATVADEPEVRFLLVHHTVNSNAYGPDDVVPLLRDIHRFHTSPAKGWPDIAYNFIVDRFGRAWETRTGSLDRPVAGDATGGNQGWDQKCAFLGDHRTVPPTREALDTMVGLLAFLADRSAIDTRPGATTTFTSRGSNLHPAGTTVQAPTIEGHRSMSQTECPGEAAYAIVRDELPSAVSARRTSGPATTPTTAAAPEPSALGPPPTETTAPPPTASSTTTAPTTSASATSAAPAAPSTTDLAAPATDDQDLPWPVVGTAGGLAAVVAGAALVLRSRGER